MDLWLQSPVKRWHGESYPNITDYLDLQQLFYCHQSKAGKSIPFPAYYTEQNSPDLGEANGKLFTTRNYTPPTTIITPRKLT